MTVVATTSAVDETRALGAALAALARPGDVVVLAGDLGAGKTALVQGFGRALGVEARITSPTFTLAHVYEGRHVVHHLDVYRLEEIGEALDLGIPELLDDGGVVLIEWGDAITPVLPHDLLEVRITFGEGDDERRLELRPVGESWQPREASLRSQLSPWAVDAC